MLKLLLILEVDIVLYFNSPFLDDDVVVLVVVLADADAVAVGDKVTVTGLVAITVTVLVTVTVTIVAFKVSVVNHAKTVVNSCSLSSCVI
jgi:hypothetical protein